jgi:hypothetical protein
MAPCIEEGGLQHPLKVAAYLRRITLPRVTLPTTVYGTGMMLTEIARLPEPRLRRRQTEKVSKARNTNEH